MSPTRYDHILESRNEADLLRRLLGERLADWILPPEHRSLQPLRLSRERGEALALFATDSKLMAEPSIIPSGFALPFVWVEDAEDSPRLPAAMIEVAGSIRRVLSEALDKDLSGWGLSPGEGMDLSELPLECGSAWAPLAAGLWVASVGGSPQSSVLSTGAWSASLRTLVGVDGLDAKIEAIKGLGLGKSVLFMPTANLADLHARGIKPDGVEMVAYPVAEADLEKAFGDHLAGLEAAPSEDRPHAERLKYGLRPWLSRKDRQAFYLKSLVRDIAARLRGRYEVGSVRRAILSLGKSFEQAVLMIHTLHSEGGALEVRLVRTPESAPLSALHPHVSKLGGVVLTEALLEDMQQPQSGLVEELTVWLEQEPDPEARVVDVTGGTGAMSALVYVVGSRVGARVLYIIHKPTEFNVPKYMEEDLVQLCWGPGGRA